MPEVKWIVEWYDSQNDVPHAVRDQFRDSHGLETVPMPVMTLDDLEAWLKSIPTRIDNTVSIEILLAQVQAWKEGKS